MNIDLNKEEMSTLLYALANTCFIRESKVSKLYDKIQGVYDGSTTPGEVICQYCGLPVYRDSSHTCVARTKS